MNLNIIIYFYIFHWVFANPCVPRKYDQESVVCVCNATYCDTYKKVEPLKKGSYVKYVSSLAGLRLHRSEETFTETTTSYLSYEIRINPSVEHQRIFGFGTHFTDSAGAALNNLPVAAQRHILNSYWSELGSEYSFARVPIGGTDFSGRYYTYMDEYEEGMQLNGFKLAEEDDVLKIPHILTAKKISHHPIRFIGTAWTAPRFMKTSNTFSQGVLKDEYYQAFADYHIKFLDAYRSRGIDFWAITTGNEPSNAFLSFMSLPSMGWNAFTAAKWLKQNLGPTIRDSKQYKNMSILIFDESRLVLPAFQLVCFDKEAMQYVDGIAVHWYSDIYTPEQILLLTTCHNKQDMFKIMTEATTGLFDPMGVRMGSWKRAEAYLYSIFSYLYYNFSGWIDWNLALYTNGGPNLTGYYVDSNILVNETAGEFYKQPTFYAMAHFSKFIPPNSVRIESQSDGKLIGWFTKVTQMAFKRPDGGIVVVLYNNEYTYVEVDIKDEARGQIKLRLHPKSLTTVIYW